MPHATEPVYAHIKVTPLATAFAAEVSGVDFCKPVPDEIFQEILSAITKVDSLLVRKPGHAFMVAFESQCSAC